MLFGVWRAKNVARGPIILAMLVLLALGVLGTLPTFLQAFASE